MGKKILAQIMAGYSTALFAYGQTGSGKTTSMMGDPISPTERGILPRLLDDLFARASGNLIKCSIIEVLFLEVVVTFCSTL